MSNQDNIKVLRTLDPNIPAIRISEQLGISRERVRQILIKEGFATRVKRSASLRSLGITSIATDKPTKIKLQSAATAAGCTLSDYLRILANHYGI